MNDTKLLRDNVRELHLLLRALGEASEDIRRKQNNEYIYYNVDFALLYPYLFGDERGGTRRLLSSLAKGMRWVLAESQAQDQYQLMISGPTVIEFFDQVTHRMHALEKRVLAMPVKYSNTDERSLRKALFTSAELREDLSHLTKAALSDRIVMPINRLLDLLASGTLVVTGDVLDVGPLDRDRFMASLERQRTRRLFFDRAKGRGLLDSEFHLKVDAANICLTLDSVQSAGSTALFVTSGAANAEGCVVGEESYARLDRTPLFMLNTHRLHDDGVIGHELEFLDSAASSVLALLGSLKKYGSWHECPPQLLQRLDSFYRDYGAYLTADENTQHAVSRHDVDEVLESIRDKDRAHELFSQAMQCAKEGAQQIERCLPVLDRRYLEGGFDFQNDPVLRRMQTRLGVLLA